eukprot:6187446-Pleurochrysis_carterae.AAC.1
MRQVTSCFLPSVIIRVSKCRSEHVRLSVSTFCVRQAAIGGHVDVAKLLLASKGSMVQRTTEGKRPLDFMIQGAPTHITVHGERAASGAECEIPAFLCTRSVMPLRLFRETAGHHTKLGRATQKSSMDGVFEVRSTMPFRSCCPCDASLPCLLARA